MLYLGKNVVLNKGDTKIICTVSRIYTAGNNYSNVDLHILNNSPTNCNYQFLNNVVYGVNSNLHWEYDLGQDNYLLSRANQTGTQSVNTITGLGNSALLNIGTLPNTVCSGNDIRLSDARTPLTHIHNATSINGLGNAALLNIGTATGTVCAGDDARLNNNSIKDSLAQTISSIINLQNTFDSNTKKAIIDYKKDTPQLLRLYPMFGENTNISNNTVNTVFVSGRVLYLPFVALKTGVINSISFAIANVGVVTNSSFRVAIYNDNGADYPSTLIATSTDLTNINAAGVKTITINATVTKNVLYWIGISLANVTGNSPHTFRGGLHDNLLGVSPSFSNYIGYTTSGLSTNTLYNFPTTIPANQTLFDPGFVTHPALCYSYSS